MFNDGVCRFLNMISVNPLSLWKGISMGLQFNGIFVVGADEVWGMSTQNQGRYNLIQMLDWLFRIGDPASGF